MLLRVGSSGKAVAIPTTPVFGGVRRAAQEGPRMIVGVVLNDKDWEALLQHANGGDRGDGGSLIKRPNHAYT
jgi:hypothetical protein